MPGGDRRGPVGRGPMTGRGLGYCSSNLSDGGYFRGYGRGMGYGNGRGRGRGRGPGFGVWRMDTSKPVSQEADIQRDESSSVIDELKDKIRSLEEELQRTRDRLKSSQIR